MNLSKSTPSSMFERFIEDSSSSEWENRQTSKSMKLFRGDRCTVAEGERWKRFGLKLAVETKAGELIRGRKGIEGPLSS